MNNFLSAKKPKRINCFSSSRYRKDYCKETSRFLYKNEISGSSLDSPVIQLRREKHNLQENISPCGTESNQTILDNAKKINTNFEFGQYNKAFTKENSDLFGYSTLNENQKLMFELISKLNKSLEKTEINYLQHEYQEKIKKQWMLLSKIIDRIFLTVFSLITLFTLSSILLQAPNLKLF